jgi:glycosyltransferase involved in cell wall biosynthesis
MTKPRLIVVGPLPPPHHGVTVSTSLVLANPELRRRFAVAHLDTSDHRSGENLGRWDLTNLRIGLANVVTLARLLKGQRGTLYLPISQSWGALLRDSLFVQLAAVRGWRVAIHLRGSEFLSLYSALPRLSRAWVRHTLGYVTSAAVVGESLRGAFGPLLPRDRIAVVPNGTLPFEADETLRDRKQVLFLSNLRVRKGVLEALAAARIVCGRIPDVRFVFAGRWESGALERRLREEAASFDGRIEFTGTIVGDGKRRLLESSAILLFPPREPEGHPRVVLEALAAGIPVVTTDRGAIGETVEDGVSGFVLASPDPTLLADRLSRLLEDDRLYESMSSAALARYTKRFTQARADALLAAWLWEVSRANLA